VKPALGLFGIEDVREFGEQIPLSLLYDFWEAIRQTTEQYALGLRLARLVRPETYEVFGYVLRTSATLGDALLRATRFVRLVTETVELSFYVEGERAILVHKPLFPDLLHPESSEFILGAIGMVARHLTGKHLVPTEVRFSHPPPPDVSFHHELFECPVYFSRPHNGYVFDSALLHTPVVSHDSQLCAVLEREAEQLLAKLPKTGQLSRKVQELLSAELRGGNPNADHIAEQLGMHPKTLSRRLKSEGTTHQQLLDQLRYQLAERYLLEPNLSIGEVAFLLGYSDTSSFNKAFKRWTGTAPQFYRQKRAASG
jgi:AraC-like DNA-binding protein